MKKILFISLLLMGCRKTISTPTPIAITDIFKQTEVSITNGQDIQFNLQSAGKYTLSLYDSVSQNVISKEKFVGISGNNVKKIYTTTFTQKTLYLYLTDSIGNQISKTKILVN